MIPEGKEIGYECEQGHINSEKKIRHAAEKGKQMRCVDCGDLLTKTLIPLYHCNSCENTWAYSGDAERPTCPDCRGKNVKPIAKSK